MSTPFTLRVATPADIETLLDLMMISSWGGIREAWERVRGRHETWRQRGHAEIANAGCEIGYTRFVVAESDGRIAGMILINLIGETNDLDPAAEPPEQKGAVALIKAAKHSVFIRELAVFDWARGQGLARSFLELVENLARSQGQKRVTLIVNDANGPAYKLYQSAGFAVQRVEPSIGHPAFPEGSMLLLLEKPLLATA